MECRRLPGMTQEILHPPCPGSRFVCAPELHSRVGAFAKISQKSTNRASSIASIENSIGDLGPSCGDCYLETPTLAHPAPEAGSESA
jgi:hypothetical protein